MRKRQSFLLTILSPENGNASFCGQLKVIASGKSSNFTSLEELYRLIADEMGEEAAQSFNQRDLPISCPRNSIQLP